MFIACTVLVPVGTLLGAAGGPALVGGRGVSVGGRRLYTAHRLVQMIGYVIAVIGGVYAMVLIYPGSRNLSRDLPFHGRFGLTTLVLLTLQPIMGIIRPFLQPMGRGIKWWAMAHKI